MMMRKMNRLSMDSEYSVSQPAMNWPPYAGPIIQATPTPNSSAAPTYMPIARAFSRVLGSCGRRPTTKTSKARTASSTTMVSVQASGVTCIQGDLSGRTGSAREVSSIGKSRPGRRPLVRCADDMPALGVLPSLSVPQSSGRSRSQWRGWVAQCLSARRLQHLAQLLLQVGDLVAQACGGLELQLRRRPVHPVSYTHL